MPLSVAAVDYVLLPRRSMRPDSATLVVLVSATLWLVGAFTLVGIASASSLFSVTLEHRIVVPQVRDPIISRGNPHLSEITLTFDDGPNPPYTSQILAILKRFGIQATFFCIGRQVAAHPEIVQQEFAAGHTIGNHTWSHPSLPTLSAPQIEVEALLLWYSQASCWEPARGGARLWPGEVDAGSHEYEREHDQEYEQPGGIIKW